MDIQSYPPSVKTVGIVHPGSMGGTLAYALKRSGHKVVWASEGRSFSTLARAKEFDIEDAYTLDSLLKQCDVVFCVVNGGAAQEIAEQVACIGFSGVYCDANGLWGEESERQIKSIITDAGIDYVEGSLYGWPHPGKPGYTDEHTIYLSGPKAQTIAQLFTDGYWEPSLETDSAKAVRRIRNSQETDTAE